jgi:hypothetical protein
VKHPRADARALRARCAAAQLNGIARSVAFVLWTYADREGRAFPSQKTIADESGFSERSVRDALVALERASIIRSEVRHDIRAHALAYVFVDEAAFDAGSDAAPPAESDSARDAGSDVRTGTACRNEAAPDAGMNRQELPEKCTKEVNQEKGEGENAAIPPPPPLVLTPSDADLETEGMHLAAALGSGMRIVATSTRAQRIALARIARGVQGATPDGCRTIASCVDDDGVKWLRDKPVIDVGYFVANDGEQLASCLAVAQRWAERKTKTARAPHSPPPKVTTRLLAAMDRSEMIDKAAALREMRKSAGI